MKQFITLLTVVFASLTALAYPANFSRLTISMFNDQAITIVMDGRAVAVRQDENAFIINDLSAGYHSIKIYRQRSNYGRRRNYNSQVIYNGNVYVKRGYHTDISINRFGKAFVDEQPMGRDNNEYDWDNTGSQPMNSQSFEQLKQTIANENFDNTKLNIAKANISANVFSAAQAKEIVQLFSFESSRLEMARFLYQYTLDKNNYFTVFDAFTYSSSKDELSLYIKQYR